MTKKQDAVTVSRVFVPNETAKVDIDRVLEILRTLPMLRRYGEDESAMKEAKEILERVKDRL